MQIKVLAYGRNLLAKPTCLVRQASTRAKKVDLAGIFPPIGTPFTKDGSQICYQGLEKNFRRWNEIPFKGYVVMGTNGEAVSLKYDERLELTRKVRSLAKTCHVIVAGTGCQSTKETIDLTVEIGQEKSADAALIITPSFFRNQMTDEALVEHYTKVANASPIPIILYSVPGNTNLDLSPDVITNLAKHENIIGLKDSSGDIGKLSHIVHATKGQDFQVLVGTAGVLLPALLMGCVGGIVALGNVVGEEVCQVHQLFLRGSIKEAIALQQRLVIPNQVMVRKHSVSGLKATLDMIGMYGGPPRLPLLPADTKQTAELRETFKAEGLL